MMFSRSCYQQLLAALLVLTSAPAIQASALFDGTSADAWLIDTKTGQVVGYDMGVWLEQYVSEDFPGIILNSNNAVLVNHLPNSSVPMSPGQPAISLTGIGDKALALGEGGQGGYSDLLLSPAAGSYDRTIAVTLRVSAALLEQGTYLLKWTVAANPQQSVSLSALDTEAAQDGYYAHTFYLVADGDYPVNVELTTEAGAVVKTLSASYTIAAGAENLRRDSDGDGLPDIIEIDIGLDPLSDDWNADLNGDGWSEFDAWLRRYCPNTQDLCVDENGLPLDSDMDNWSDFDEMLRGTNHLDPEPVIDGAVILPANQPPVIPDFHFCTAGDTFYFNLVFENSADEVIFRVGADASPFVSPVESIRINFDQNGNVTRLVEPAVTTSTTPPPNDRWLDGLISDFTLEPLAPGVWRIHGSVPVGANPFLPGDSVYTVAVRDASKTIFSGQVEISANKTDCDVNASTNTGISELAEQQRLRFKDYPSVSRLYEVEYQIDSGALLAPVPAALNPDQQSTGEKLAAYSDIVVQSFTSVENNIAGVDVVVAADAAGGVDDLILNIWSGSLRAELVHSQTLRNVKIDPLLDTVIPFRFEAIALPPAMVYFLEFRKRTAKLASTGSDSYPNGEVLEADGSSLAGQPDLIFATYSDSSFANGIAGTRAEMNWRTALAASINGKPFYNADSLLSANEITQAGLSAGEIAARLRRDAAATALAAGALPAMRLPAGDSTVINAVHEYLPAANNSFDTPQGYSRMYKHWLPRMTDVTPLSMLDEIGQGSWVTAEEWRNAFVAYLWPRLTLPANPQITVDNTLAINAIEAVLSEESYLQGLSKQQIFASLNNSGDSDFSRNWEQSLRRFALPDFTLDESINTVTTELAAGQLLSAQGDWLRATFFASQPGTRSDEYIALQLQRSYDASCFIRNELLLELQADATQWNNFFDSCPDYFTESELNQSLADDQLRRYQLRLLLLPDVATALADVSLLELATDSDADNIENTKEIYLAVERLTLPWLADSDGDGIIDGEDFCANDPLDECSANPVLPIIMTDASVTAAEPFSGSGAVLVSVRLDRIYDEAITVYYETIVAAGDTATAGVDFTVVSGSVVIAPGQQSALIEVPVIADGIADGGETFSLQITGADNATVDGDGLVLVTLNDPNLLHTIGGNVAGLNGIVVLQNNNGDGLDVNANGGFSFATVIGDGQSYNVSVLSQPLGQHCSVSYFSGMASADVSNIEVNCAGYNYIIGGNVSGLAGTVVLQNNNGDNLTVSANGDFSFATAIEYGLPYSVSVLTQPAGQICIMNNASGTATANVSNVGVSCSTISVDLPAAPANFVVTAASPKTLTFSWDVVADATHYNLLKNPDGVSGFAELYSGITVNTVAEIIPVHLYDWVNATYIVQACNGAGCTDSNVIASTSAMINAIGYFKASNTEADDQFGWSVALSDDGSTLAVGAIREDSAAIGIEGDQSDNAATNAGAVYVFTRSAGSWIQQAYLKASNTDANDAFGYALALSADGNTLAVSATGEDSNATVINGDQVNNSASSSGAVYVFTRSAGSWSQQAYIKASDSSGGDLFGFTISLSADGNTLAVGATSEDSSEVGISTNGQSNFSASNSGAVYVFTRSGNSWSQQAYVKASNTGTGDQFGGVVALSDDGNTLAVAARYEASTATGINGDETDNAASWAGAAYVFTRSAGSWSQQAYIKASNTEANDLFGWGLALSGDGNTLAVGSIDEDSIATGINGDQLNNSTSNSGAAYVFTRSAGSWSQQAYIKASNTGTSDEFGWSLALSADGNTLAVGSSGEQSTATGINGNQSINTFNSAGAVYVFKRENSNTWSQRAYVKASNTWAVDAYGRSLSLSADGDTLAVGAIYEDSNATGINGDQSNDAALSSGAAYVY